MEIDSGSLTKKIKYWKEGIVNKAGKVTKQVNLEARKPAKVSQGHVGTFT